MKQTTEKIIAAAEERGWIDEQDMKDILAAAPKSQRGWIRTRLGYMVVL